MREKKSLKAGFVPNVDPDQSVIYPNFNVFWIFSPQIQVSTTIPELLHTLYLQFPDHFLPHKLTQIQNRPIIFKN